MNSTKIKCSSISFGIIFVIWLPQKKNMKYREVIHRQCLIFSCWSKKGYSIFAGLGREIRIARLALHMYDSVLLKSASNGVIVNTDCMTDVAFRVKLWNNILKITGSPKGEVCPDGYRIVIQ